MIVTKITVTASRVRPDPVLKFSTIRPEIQIEAEIGPEDDWQEEVVELQQKAERLVEDHTNLLISRLRKIAALEKPYDQIMIDLEIAIREAEETLRVEREKHPDKTRLVR